MRCSSGASARGNPELPAEDCVVIPVQDLLPRRRGEREHFRNPRQWFEFLRWVFRLEADEKRGVLRCPAVSPLRHPGGTVYLLQSGATIELKGLRDFCRMIDRQVEQGTDAPSTAFEDWFVASHDRLMKEGVETIFLSPDTGGE